MTIDEQKNTGMPQKGSSDESQKGSGSNQVDDPKPAGDKQVQQPKADIDA